MNREDAILLSKIYGIEKKQNREIYPEDLASTQVLSKNKCQDKIQELKNGGFLDETVKNGANIYSVSRKGIQHMCAYRDLKADYDRLCVTYYA